MDPHRTGIFLGQCAQYCGTQHAKMLLRVSVDSAEDFDAGFARSSSPRARGRRGLRRQKSLRNDRVHQLPRGPRHGREWTLRSRSDALDEPRHDRVRRRREHAGQTASVDSESRRDQAGLADAGHAADRRRAGRTRPATCRRSGSRRTRRSAMSSTRDGHSARRG